jgi:regulator of sirC expression with transglutaminase-like and TPR domain
MSERLPLEPLDPRLLPAAPGEEFRRRHRVRNLLATVGRLDADRQAEVAQEILLHGKGAIPEVRAAAHGSDPEAAALARSLLPLLAPDEIGMDLSDGLDEDEMAYPLELGATLLARLGDPALEARPVLRQIEALAQKARRHIAEVLGAPLTPKLLKERLFDVIFHLGEFWRTEGFKGNVEDYYDVRNSWLPHVLEQRTGLPILLSIIYLALCRQVGLKAEGIGLPWHFVVRIEVALEGGEGYVFVDPFHGARPLDLDDCKKLVQAAGQKFDPEEHLQPVAPRQVLARICNNLLTAYDYRKQTREAERVATVLIHLSPRNPVPRLIRAERRLRRGEYRLARRDLSELLTLDPPAAVAQAALSLLKQIEYEHPM